MSDNSALFEDKIQYPHAIEIADLMLRAGFRKIIIDMVLSMLSENADDDAEIEKNMEIFLKYISFKGADPKSGEVELKAMQLRSKEYSTPRYLAARYIGETKDELIHGKIYSVDMTYGIDDEFLIYTNEDEPSIYPAELFEPVVATRIRFEGYWEDEYTPLPEPDKRLVAGKEYDVHEKMIDHELWFECDEGVCRYYNAEIVEGVASDAHLPKGRKLDDKNTAAKLIRRAVEFGMVKDLYRSMSENCSYHSEISGAVLTGRRCIAEHFRDVADNQLEQGEVCKADEAVIVKSERADGVPVGTACVLVQMPDAEPYFITTAEYDCEISGIGIYNSTGYEFKFSTTS